MTALLSGSRRRRAGGLPERLGALREVVELGTGRLDADLLAGARGVLGRAGERLQLSGEHTVVALAGATGSGKSSLFNALSGVELSRVGVRRPTTAQVHACVWGSAGSEPLLDWIGVSHRHAVDGTGDAELQGLVLLDLPDHDSTERNHRLEVDRLVELVDLLVWVVDPQKYADAALHDRYLRPLAGHAGVMVVVLNQVDKLPAVAARDCVDDLGRLLRADGLADPPVLAVSARTGAGLAELRGLLAEAVRRREALTERIEADVDREVARIGAEVGGEGGSVGRRDRDLLVDALARAAGVPAVVDAVGRSYSMRAVAATGWPFTRWVRRLRPDPLRRLHLDGGGAGEAAGRSSLPVASPVARSQVDGAVRRVVDAAGTGLPRWEVEAVRRAARGDEEDLSDALDRAVAGTDLGVSRRPVWWSLFGGLQWLLALVAAAGLVWLLVLFGLDWARIPEPPTPEYRGWPVPTLLLLGGVLGGLLLALIARFLARLAAAAHRRRADARLRECIGGVADSHILAPVAAELETYRRLRERLAAARR